MSKTTKRRKDCERNPQCHFVWEAILSLWAIIYQTGLEKQKGFSVAGCHPRKLCFSQINIYNKIWVKGTSIQHFSVKHYNKTLFGNDCLSHKLLCLNIKEFTPRFWKFTFYMWFDTLNSSSSLGSSYLGSPQQPIYLHFAISLAASSFIPTCHYTPLHNICEFFPHFSLMSCSYPSNILSIHLSTHIHLTLPL